MAVAGMLRPFLLDNRRMFYYSGIMLDGIKIFSSDSLWQQILRDLGATITDESSSDIDFDLLNLPQPTSPIAIKAAVMDAMDNTDMLMKIFGRPVSLSRMQSQIVMLLYKSGGMSSAQLRTEMGYAPDTSTHAIDTAIYQLRRNFGRDFIRNNDGIYQIGRI